jgi:hypothetical protein
MQPSPHATNGGEHDPTHDPLWQKGDDAVQTLPHDPQLEASASNDRHTPPHDVVPPGHSHDPFAQTSPDVHGVPHDPQFSGSELVRMHDSPHAVCPGAGHVHVSDTHACAGPHALPHAPQLFGSDRVSVHTPLHRC